MPCARSDCWCGQTRPGMKVVAKFEPGTRIAEHHGVFYIFHPDHPPRYFDPSESEPAPKELVCLDTTHGSPEV
jgi:hypothetical protein